MSAGAQWFESTTAHTKRGGIVVPPLYEVCSARCPVGVSNYALELFQSFV